MVNEHDVGEAQRSLVRVPMSRNVKAERSVLMDLSHVSNIVAASNISSAPLPERLGGPRATPDDVPRTRAENEALLATLTEENRALRTTLNTYQSQISLIRHLMTDRSAAGAAIRRVRRKMSTQLQ